MTNLTRKEKIEHLKAVAKKRSLLYKPCLAIISKLESWVYRYL